MPEKFANMKNICIFAALLLRYRLSVRTLGFQPKKLGSIPNGAAKEFLHICKFLSPVKKPFCCKKQNGFFVFGS